ncbi:MAG: hypothetical protein QHH05_03910, partial [Syntrophomonadaceae bacterium]|nr:hypothetical protein [Syntrophomonadaceae bacterium]
MARRGIGVMVATVMLLVAACLGAGPAGAVLAAPAARGPGHPVLFARVWPYYPVASIVSTKSGEVLVKEPGGAWEPVRLFTPLPDGTQVQTSEGSRALLLTPTYPAWTYALLDADSRVELVRPSARTAARADLRLHQGRVWFYTRARYYAGEATLSAGGLGVAVQGPVDVVAEMKPSWAEARVLSGEVVADDGSLLQAGQGLRRSP